MAWVVNAKSGARVLLFRGYYRTTARRVIAVLQDPLGERPRSNSAGNQVVPPALVEELKTCKNLNYTVLEGPGGKYRAMEF